MSDLNNPISKELIESIKIYSDALLKTAESMEKLIATGNSLIETNNKINQSDSTSTEKKKQLTAVEKESQRIRNQQLATHAKLDQARSQAVKSLDRSKIELQELNKTRRDSIKLERTEAGSLSRLRAENSKLRKERDNLNITTEEGIKELKRLNSIIDANDKKIKESTDAYTKSKIEVGNYKKNISEALKEQDVFGVSVSKLGVLFSTAAGAIGAGVAILTGLAKAYASSARGAEDLARAQDRLNSISRQIGNALADEAGEVGFLDRILAALQQQYLGLSSAIESNVEVALRARLRQIEVEEIDQERQKKAQLDRTEQLRQIRDEERNSFKERKDANNELANIINTRESETIAFQEKRLSILEKLLSLDKGNLDLQKQIKQVEFEIADAREEAQGFRSEQLANDLALSREFSANQIELTQKQIEAQILATKEGSRERFGLEKQLIEKTRQLQIQFAGNNDQLRDIANKDAENSLKELEDSYKKSNKIKIQEENKTLNDIIQARDSGFDKILLENKAFEDQMIQNALDGAAARKFIADREANERKELQKKMRDASIDLSAQAIQGIADVTFEAANQRREEELERIEEQREEDLERVDTQTEEDLAAVQDKFDRGIITEDQAASQRTAINERAAEEKKKIEEKSDRDAAAIKTKQAKADKKAALISVAIDTAVSIAKTAAQLGFPAAIPFIAIAAAAGAIQAATIAATPVPKFEKGTDGKFNTPDTFVAGEAGIEMIVDRSGRAFLTPDSPTLYSNMPNQQVIPNKETQRILANIAIGKEKFNDNGIRKDLQTLIKVSKKQNRSSTIDSVTTTRYGRRQIKKHESFLAMRGR